VVGFYTLLCYHLAKRHSVKTARVKIAYRPLRIGWAIRAGDLNAFRTAVRLSFALWGGAFNPIIVVDREKQAKNLVDQFRVDVILPIGNSEELQSFTKHFSHLISPFLPNQVFLDDGAGGARSQVLDVHNTLVHLDGQPALEKMKERGVRLYTWEPDDPLADVFLMQFGDYPSADEIHISYRDILGYAAQALEVKIAPAQNVPTNIFQFPSIRFVSRSGLERHYGVQPGWDTPGFFSGDAGNFDDLVCYWNLRASDLPLLFVDPKHLGRYGETVTSWGGWHTLRKLVKPWVPHPSRLVHEGCGIWLFFFRASALVPVSKLVPTK